MPESDYTAKTQFRVLYREFLFRTVDLELLSPQGDMSKLLGQFAALLVLAGSLFGLGAMGFGDSRVPRTELLISAWGIEHILIATTMLVVGLFAVLSWDSTFPDLRDVLVLGPLPVRARTLFLAKVSASATALSVTVFALNAFTGITLPLALAPSSSSLLDLILSPDRYRLLAAFWITMLAAGAFIFCCVLAVQGVAAQLLPRGRFLRLSAVLQMAAFCAFVIAYFLQPSWANPQALSAPENQSLLAWLPSYWFLGLFQQLSGTMHAAMIPLARRAWFGLGIVLSATAVAWMLSYFRTLRKIVEEPDILPSSRGLRWYPRFGDSLSTAIMQFSIRTLLRSRRHRVMLAFYLAIASAVAILLMKAGLSRRHAFGNQVDIRLLFSSLMVMLFWVAGSRVVFSMPFALRANWIFRMTEVRGTQEYLAAIRSPLFVVAVAPVWIVAAVFFFSIWPWRLGL